MTTPAITPQETAILSASPQVLALYNQFKSDFATIVSEAKEGKDGIPSIVATVLLTLVPQLMTAVGQVAGQTGAQKKQLVISALNLGIAELPLDVAIRNIIETTADKLIDTLINVEQNQITFNPAVKSWFTKLFGSCCSCCGNSATVKPAIVPIKS
jgi:hypothetical protein